MTVINFAEKFNLFSDHWSPKVIAEMNDYQFKLVKIQGEFIWHDHGRPRGHMTRVCRVCSLAQWDAGAHQDGDAEVGLGKAHQASVDRVPDPVVQFAQTGDGQIGGDEQTGRVEGPVHDL